VALAADVASDGEGDGDRDVEGLAVGELVGEVVAERVGFGDPDGVADGEVVGPSAIAGVPKKDTVNATARSGGARNRCTCKTPERLPHEPQRADTSLLSGRARAAR
jgi:hypothetical protein